MRRLLKQMAIILALRPALQMLRSIARLGFGFEETWAVSAAFCGMGLLLLSVAVLLGWLRVTPATKVITKMLGVTPIARSLQVVVSALVLAAQTQDLVFLLYYGGENLGQVFAALLYVYEIVFAD